MTILELEDKLKKGTITKGKKISLETKKIEKTKKNRIYKNLRKANYKIYKNKLLKKWSHIKSIANKKDK